jgi:hypothetical protein
MSFLDRLRGGSGSAQAGLNPIVQKVPLPTAPPRPSLARPAAKPAPPAPVSPPAREAAPEKSGSPLPTPSETLSHFRRGLMYQSAGDHARAVEEFNQVLAHDPAAAEAYASRGISREFLGDLAGARADYARSIELEVKAEIRRQARAVEDGSP